MLIPQSWWISNSEQAKGMLEEAKQPMREPTKKSDIKVIFDSFYEEDYGVVDIHMEEQAPQGETGRLSHQRKRDYCVRDDASQSCVSNHSSGRNLDARW